MSVRRQSREVFLGSVFIFEDEVRNMFESKRRKQICKRSSGRCQQGRKDMKWARAVESLQE